MSNQKGIVVYGLAGTWTFALGISFHLFIFYILGIACFIYLLVIS